MGLAEDARHLKRHATIARLLLKHGRTSIVRRAGLEDVLADGVGDPGPGGDPEELARDLERMGPTFVKLGQLLSTRPDLLPAEYLDALARLQDRVEPVPFAEVREVLEDELGTKIGQVFQVLDEAPVASASLGQVHRAVLRDGRLVAVKVQRPDIRGKVAADLEGLEQIASFLDRHTRAGHDYDFGRILREFREVLVRELDYTLEARNLEVLGENLEKFDRLVVPQPVRGFTTSRVLVMDYVRGEKISAIGPLRHVELEGAELAEQVFTAYLQQVLVDGFFHADPHPGNVFLTDDDRIALIDLGMVERLTPRMRDRLAKVLVAISEGDGEGAAEVALELGEPLDGFDRRRAVERIATLISWQDGRTVEQMEMGSLILDVVQLCRECGVRPSSQLTMLGKTLLNLDRVGRMLSPSFTPNEAIRRYTAHLVTHATLRSLWPGNFLGALIDSRELVRQLPSRVHAILTSLANNELRVNVDAIDERRLIQGFQKVANRITIGLILAALIVGAALLVRVETDWTILGYPGLAILLFLSAAVGGVGLIVDILRKDE